MTTTRVTDSPVAVAPELTVDDVQVDKVGTAARPGIDLFLGVALLGMILLPLAIAQRRLFGNLPGDLLRGDLNVIEVRVARAWYEPLTVGAYSRSGFAHPGPAMYYAMTPVYRLAGGGVNGLLAATLTVVAVSATGVMTIGRAMLGRLGLATAGLVMAVLSAAGWPLLSWPWNPSIGAFPCLLALVAATGVVAGHRRLLVVVVAAGSFAVQAHVGYVGIVGAVLLVAVGVVAARSLAPDATDTDKRRGVVDRARLVAASLLWPAATGLVLWAPPILQQITAGDQGNLGLIVRGLGEPSSVDLATSWRAVAGAMGPAGDWVSGHDLNTYRYGNLTPLTGVVPAFGWSSVGFLLALVGASVWRRRSRARLGLGVVALGAAVWSTHSISGPPYTYLYLWLPVVAGFLYLCLLWSGIELAGETNPTGRSLGVAVSVLACGALGPTLWGRVAPLGSAAQLVLGAAIAASVAALALSLVRPHWWKGIQLFVVAASIAAVTTIGAGTAARSMDGLVPPGPDTVDQMAAITAMADRIAERDGAVGLRWPSTGEAGEVPQLLADALAQRGVDVRVPSFAADMFGPELVATGSEPNEITILPDAHPAPARARRVGTDRQGLAFYLNRVP